MRPGLQWAALALALLTGGCAAFAGKADYRDYRAVRLAPNEQARQLAMQRYTSQHPDGRWYTRYQLERNSRDTPTYEFNKATRAGLEFYLAAYPDGAFAGQASSRLAAIEQIEERKRQELARAEKLELERKKREAELRRTWVTRFVEYWLATLLSIERWGEPIATTAQGNPKFSEAFGRPPRPHCTTEECVKYYVSSYAIPVPGSTRLERTMQLILRLRMTGGKLTGADLLMPGLGFSRWSEVEQRNLVVDTEVDDRTAAVEWVFTKLTAQVAKLAKQTRPEADFLLPPVAKPAIDYTGELTDTTVTDPSQPANTIQSGEAVPQASVDDLVQPAQPEAEADMVMAPLEVGADGRVRTSDQTMEMAPMEVPAAGGGPVMEMAPLEVPPEGGTAAAGSTGGVAAAAGTVRPTAAPPRVQSVREGNLRIVVFAAGTEGGGNTFDGVRIEVVSPPGAGAD